MNLNLLMSAIATVEIDGVLIPEEELEDRTFICDCCGQRHLKTNEHLFNGEHWCDDCIEGYTFVCQRCGDRHTRDEARNVHGVSGMEEWCGYCAERYASQCEQCGELYDHDLLLDGFDGFVCGSCWDEHDYRECPECGTNVPGYEWDNEHNMCRSCAEHHGDSDTEPRSDNARVRYYHSAPPLQWFGDEHCGIGVELEVDSDYGSGANMQRALNHIDRIAGEHLHFEHDGSLRNGFEIVTQPHTLQAFNEVPWAEILEACEENGFSSHDIGTCGLHVHFSREMFGADTETQDDNIAKLIQFVDMHWDDMVKASRRTPDQLGSWCAKKGTVSKKKIKEDVTNKNGSRYSAVNNTNTHTVEIRLMRGTLKYSSFMACIDMLATLVKNSCRIDWDEVCEAAEMLRGIGEDTRAYLARQGAFYEAVCELGNF